MRFQCIALKLPLGPFFKFLMAKSIEDLTYLESSYNEHKIGTYSLLLMAKKLQLFITLGSSYRQTQAAVELGSVLQSTVKEGIGNMW